MDPYYGKWLPIDISTHGHKIDSLILWVHLFMLALFIGWGVYYVYCLFKFRARKGQKAQYAQIKGKASKYVEVVVIVIEVVLLLGLSMPIWADFKTMPADAANPFHVRVFAQQFAWNFHYPGKDGKFGARRADLIDEVSNPIGLDREGDPAAADDFSSTNNMHVPVNRLVIATISSRDVIHSFAIPVMRIKQDAVPGLSVPVWFQATRATDPVNNPADKDGYDIACAQLCGNSHYKMKGQFYVDTPEALEKWMAEMAPAPLDEGGGAADAQPFDDEQPAAAPAEKKDEAAPAAAAPVAAAPKPANYGPVQYKDGFDNH